MSYIQSILWAWWAIIHYIIFIQKIGHENIYFTQNCFILNKPWKGGEDFFLVKLYKQIFYSHQNEIISLPLITPFK